MLLNIDSLVEEIRKEPYEIIKVYSKYSGKVFFDTIQEGSVVYPALGTWKEIPATTLATIEREKNKKPIFAIKKATVKKINSDLEGSFVESGTELMTLNHYLSKDEVVERILKKALHLFRAPERAKYYFLPEVDKKIHISGLKSIHIKDGMPLFIMSRMKREVSVSYEGPEGILYSSYFTSAENVEAGSALIGVCQEEVLGQIEEVISRIQCDWEEEY